MGRPSRRKVKRRQVPVPFRLPLPSNHLRRHRKPERDDPLWLGDHYNHASVEGEGIKRFWQNEVIARPEGIQSTGMA